MSAMSVPLSALCLFALSGGAGCAMNSDAAVPLVRVHAEKDLKCPSDEIPIRSKLGGRYEASGCGRTATYDSACVGLQCNVSNEEDAAPGWRDRPDPNSMERNR